MLLDDSGPVNVDGSPVEMVNHPRHYNVHPSGIECIDIIEGMSLTLGTGFKYIHRRDDKNNLIQDLEKSRWYFNRAWEQRDVHAGALRSTEIARRNLKIWLHHEPPSFVKTGVLFLSEALTNFTFFSIDNGFLNIQKCFHQIDLAILEIKEHQATADILEKKDK